ncbi:uncharacterized protein LOC109949440 isoform X1 [Prunus persica]|uniref:uncharacterized protein LOC109949440 isoform X1 n=1 Tax=Prunus persica TaxID=3760 RepID=UPI0009AB3F62|nr:uncharacterized protein LOC109949440 isoform X1 [Prunus persica]
MPTISLLILHPSLISTLLFTRKNQKKSNQNYSGWQTTNALRLATETNVFKWNGAGARWWRKSRAPLVRLPDTITIQMNIRPPQKAPLVEQKAPVAVGEQERLRVSKQLCEGATIVATKIGVDAANKIGGIPIICCFFSCKFEQRRRRRRQRWTKTRQRESQGTRKRHRE